MVIYNWSKTMPKPYDYDLSKRVIRLINDDNKRRYVSELLNISIPTIDRWILLYKETGDVKVRKEIKTGRKTAITDFNKFSKFIEKNKLLSLHEMSEKWDGNMCFMTIYRNLRKLGKLLKNHNIDHSLKHQGKITNYQQILQKKQLRKQRSKIEGLIGNLKKDYSLEKIVLKTK